MNDSQVISTGPCPSCSSSDAFTSYDDGHAYCFSCEHYVHRTDGSVPTTERRSPISRDLIAVRFTAIPARHLREDTCKKWGYGYGKFKGHPVHVAQWKDKDGRVAYQKVRSADKHFSGIGDASGRMLYGQWLWRDKGKRVVITEGEIDALSVSQSQDNKWPVVSLPDGAQSASKAIKKNLEWLEGFDEIVLCFDNDEPGIKAVHKVAPLFSPGKCKVARLPEGFKDANDMLVKGKQRELQDCLWGAKTYRPDGIVNGEDLWETIKDGPPHPGTPYPWQGLNDKLLGIRPGEIVTVTAGSGVGKSQVCRELAMHLHNKGDAIGYIALEENNARTALGFVGLELDKPLHINTEGTEEDEIKQAFARSVGSGRFYLYDHWGSVGSDNLLARIRFMAKSCACRWVVLDHLSIVVSGISDGDERRLIDNLMTKLRSLVEETGIGLVLVVHLKRPSMGKGWNEGRQVSLADLRGSSAIEGISDCVIAVERNQQDEKNPDLNTIRVLKNRFAGMCGEACYLQYDHKTGRMREVDEPDVFNDDDNPNETETC